MIYLKELGGPMIVSENLPDDSKEISEEYRKISKELKELRSDPEQIKGG